MMIGKIIQGRNFKACLDYVMGKKGAVIIDTNIIGNNASEYAHELDSFARQRPNLEKKVCHMMLSLPVHEKLEDGTWSELLNQYLTKMGFADSHFIAVKHSDRSHEHIHIVANRVTLDGNVVSDSWDRMHSQEAIRQIEKDYGLTQVKSSWECDRSCASKTTGELVYEAKTGMISIKSQIADRVNAALAKSTNMPELIAELNADRVGVKISENRSGQPMGISYNLDNLSVAGSKIGRIYSYSQIVKRLENNVRAAERIPQVIAQPQGQNISPLEQKLPLEQNATAERIPKAIALMEIPAIIRANVKPNMTMPELVDCLKEAGVDAHVKYTRTNKVKGISFSVGNESIPGNELGKEFSFNGLQKHLGVSFNAERDNPKLNRKSINKLKGDGRSQDELRPVEIKPSGKNLAEISVVPEIKPEGLKPPEAVVTILESSTVKPILKNQADRTTLNESPQVNPILEEEAHEIESIGRNVLEAEGKSEYSGKDYYFKSEGNTLAIARLETQEVILQVTDGVIEINNLTRLDVEKFNIAAQKRDDDRRTREKQIEGGKMPEMER